MFNLEALAFPDLGFGLLCVRTEEDLLVKPQKEWVHMNKVEPEKLEWMRDLPAPRRKGTKKVENYVLQLKKSKQKRFSLTFSSFSAFSR